MYRFGPQSELTKRQSKALMQGILDCMASLPRKPREPEEAPTERKLVTSFDNGRDPPVWGTRSDLEAKAELEELPELDTDSDDDGHCVPAAIMEQKPFYSFSDKMLGIPANERGTRGTQADILTKEAKAPPPPPPVVEPLQALGSFDDYRHRCFGRVPEPFTFPSGQTAMMFGIPMEPQPPRVWTPRENTDLPSAYAQYWPPKAREQYARGTRGCGANIFEDPPTVIPMHVVARVIQPILSTSESRLVHISTNTTMTFLDHAFEALERGRERLATKVMQLSYHWPLYHPVSARVRRPEVIDISHFSRYPPPTIIRPEYPRAVGVKIPLPTVESPNAYCQFYQVLQADGSVKAIPLFEHGFMDTKYSLPAPDSK